MDTFSPKVLHAAARLEIRARRPIASLLAGDYRSAFRGSGMQFKEFRNYEAGDDIRHMSWTVTARTRRPTVKLFEEERELNTLLLADMSGSSLMGSGAHRKIDMYAEVTALLGLAAAKASDPFGVLLFTDTVQAYLPPRRSRDAVRTAVNRIRCAPLAGGRSDLSMALAYAARTLKARSVVFILSDFLLPSFEGSLASLARRHEVTLLHGFDPMERGDGPRGVHPVWDPETGEWLLLDGGSPSGRARLADSQTHLVDSLQQVTRTCGADYLPLCTEGDYLEDLVTFFRRRGTRR